MLYPIVSNWWNSKVQSRAVANYDAAVENINDGYAEKIINEANMYNRNLAALSDPLADYKKLSGYDSILDISGTGIMGYITIPIIQAEFPIYHGTSEEVLNIAAGHLEGSAFPVGGKDTHAVISAHRGLPSAKLFTDLDKVVVGDTFTITILNNIYTYEVEKILIVEPHEMNKLDIISGCDYVTLMTCTPYGVNTHRLLLRAHRIETIQALNVKVNADAVQVDPMLVVPLIAAIPLLILLCFWIFGGKKKKSPYGNLNYMIYLRKDGD